MKIVTAAEMRRIDSTTIRSYGIPGRVLMERAGLAVTKSILERTSADTKVLVVAGKGNNGGDGLVVARELVRAGRNARVMLIARADELKGDTRDNYETALKFGVKVREGNRKMDLKTGGPGLIVDALLGTGISQELREPVRGAVTAINRSRIPVTAVDLPTGISADTGKVLGEAVQASWTVTFGLPKRGHYLYPGAGFCGKVLVADIGFPRNLLEDPSLLVELTDEESVHNLLPLRRPDVHKGSCGHVMVVAGSRHMKGAPVMVALAAFRAGAGLVTVAAPEAVLAAFPRELMEAITLPLPESPGGALDPSGLPELLNALPRVDALAVGPGLSREPEVEEFVEKLLRHCPKPVVLDADGINALEGRPEVLAARRGQNLILTPHPAEMGRLLGCGTLEIQENRLECLSRCVEATAGKTVVLKGPHTLVSGPRGRIFVNASGNDGLATAGSGDVLTGILATLLAQGVNAPAAARLGVWVHGRAGDLALETTSRRALMSRDVIGKIPQVLESLDNRRDSRRRCTTGF